MRKNKALTVALFSLLAVLFAGCASTRINWNDRIGHYSYDQAVTDLGPPDKSARLTDGKLVVDWITRYNNGGAVFINGGPYPGSVGIVTTIPPSSYADILRLTFDTNNLMCAWVKK